MDFLGSECKHDDLAPVRLRSVSLCQMASGGVARKRRPAPVRVTPWSMGRGLMELGSPGTAIP